MNDDELLTSSKLLTADVQCMLTVIHWYKLDAHGTVTWKTYIKLYLNAIKFAEWRRERIFKDSLVHIQAFDMLLDMLSIFLSNIIPIPETNIWRLEETNSLHIMQG